MSTIHFSPLKHLSVLFLFLTTLLTTASATNVTFSSYTISGNTGADFTIAVNVPSHNQDDDLYFHASGPGGESWIAFGFGTGMSGALIFVIYGSADGKNVTVSPRLGTGHVMPTYTSGVKIELMEGSGLVNGNYVANAKCTGCRSRVNVTSTSQPMIWAVCDGNSLDTDDVAATIQQHSEYGSFYLNLVHATGPGGVPSGSTIKSSSGSTGGSVEYDNYSIARAIHGLLLCGSFVIGFPAGYLFLRIFERLWMHWIVQSLAAFLVLAGMAGGIALSKRHDISPNLTAPHQIIGFIVVFLVLSSWTMGLVGHKIYQKTQRPAVPMRIHRILGPVTILLGLVNCAVGFHFAGKNSAIIGFVVVTTFMVIIVNTLVFFSRRRKQRRNAMTTPAAANFRAGMDEGPLYAGAGGVGGMNSGPNQQEEGVSLQPYNTGGDRPQPYSLPSHHSNGGYEGPQGQPPRV